MERKRLVSHISELRCFWENIHRSLQNPKASVDSPVIINSKIRWVYNELANFAKKDENLKKIFVECPVPHEDSFESFVKRSSWLIDRFSEFFEDDLEAFEREKERAEEREKELDLGIKVPPRYEIDYGRLRLLSCIVDSAVELWNSLSPEFRGRIDVFLAKRGDPLFLDEATRVQHLVFAMLLNLDAIISGSDEMLVNNGGLPRILCETADAISALFDKEIEITDREICDMFTMFKEIATRGDEHIY